MTSIGIAQILLFFGLILLVTKPVGLFMSRLFQGERTLLHPILRPLLRGPCSTRFMRKGALMSARSI